MKEHVQPVSLVWMLGLLVAWTAPTSALTVTSAFNQRGISGTITFSQGNSSSPTSISVDLQGLEQFPNETYPWHVHLYPFPLSGILNPCAVEFTGGHYDPLGASLVDNYTQVCDSDPAQCEIGDLSGKFGRLNASGRLDATDPNLSLHGFFGIIGRSIVLHRGNGDRYACANIDYPPSDAVELLYSPFRTIFTGNIYFRQHTDAFTSTVYADLVRIDGTEDSTGHNWHVHESPVDFGDSSCSTAGPHYNPRMVPIGPGTNYSTLCDPSAPGNCEIGDLTGKSAPLDVVGGVTKTLYTDTDLPLVGDDLFILSRSVVIHEANQTAPRLSCANITRFRPLEAVAYFNEDGVSGEIRFLQNSPFDETEVMVSLTGLRNMAGGYHVHEFPVGPQGPGSERCGVQFAGGHWNPLGVVYSDEDPPVTSDEYEIGDLSGKFGSLDGKNDITETFRDPNIPLSGRNSILGRSIVIHYPNGSRWLCANIEYTVPVVRFSATYNISGVELRFTFVQPADDPFADTTIVVEGDLMEVFPQTTPSSTPSPTPFPSSFPSPSPSSESPSSPLPSVVVPPSSSSLSSSDVILVPFSSSSLSQQPSTVASFSSSSVSSGSATTLARPGSSSRLPVSPSVSGMTTGTEGPQTSTEGPQTSTAGPQTSTEVPQTSTEGPQTSTEGPQTSTEGPQTSTAGPQTSTEGPQTSTEGPQTSTEGPQTSTAGPQISTEGPQTSTMVSAVQETPRVSASSAASASSVPSVQLSTMGFEGSGMSISESAQAMMLMPLSTDLTGVSQTPSPASSPGARRRKRWGMEDSVAKGLPRRPSGYRVRRQVDVGVGWSLRGLPAGQGLPSDCSSLPTVDPFMSSASCSPSSPLTCPVGDLMGKHGSLGLSSGLAVFSDPNLPLSGPNSILGPGSQAVLLLEPLSPSAGSSPACALVLIAPPTPEASPSPTPEGSSSTIPSATPTVAPPPGGGGGSGDDNVILIAAVAGGVGGALLLVIVIIIVVLCCCKCRGSGYMYNLRKARDKNVELGSFKPVEPQIGSSQYQAVRSYNPPDNIQNEEDLRLATGEWVTLLEAPLGGEWWKGAVGEKEGWFPRKYVEWVDVEGERRKAEEENFKLAAAAIVAASSTFSTRHGSLSQKRAQEVTPKAKSQRTSTFSKRDIDSTPKLVTGFDEGGDKQQLTQEVGGLELGAELEAVVIENIGKEGSMGGSTPDTPRSQRAEIIANKEALDQSPAPSPLPWARDTRIPVSPLVTGAVTQEEPHYANINAAPALPSDIHVAKYDFIGSTNIELPLRKGDMINVTERADNGWWKGTLEGRVGWFPESYVRPPSQEEMRRLQDAGMGPAVEQPRGMDEMMAQGEELEASEYRAIFTFQSETEGDLRFAEGETVLVYWSHDNGWWYGAASGEQGWFPGSYVEPIVDTSAAASLTASPAPEPQSVEEGGLTGEITAAVKSRQGRKQDGSLKKRKKWSFRFGRDKSAEAEGETSKSELLPSPTPAEQSLQDEISRALLHSPTSSSPAVVTGSSEGRHLSIDERLALAKDSRAREDQQSELAAALTRRAKLSESDQPTEAPAEEKPEAQPQETSPAAEKEDAAQPAAQVEKPAEEGEEEGREVEERGREVEEGGHKGMEAVESKGGVREAAEKTEGHVESTKDGDRDHSLTSEADLTPVGTPSKPRRKAPPPPAVTAVAASAASKGSSSPRTPGRAKRAAPAPPKSSTLVTTPTQPPTSTPPPAQTQTLPTAKLSQSPKPSPSPPKPAPSHTPPSLKPESGKGRKSGEGAPVLTPLSHKAEDKKKVARKKDEKANLQPISIPKSFTMAGPARAQQVPRVKPIPQHRRTTGIDHKAKPRRRPPPPPQGVAPGTGVAVLPPVPASRLPTVSEDDDSVFAESPVAKAMPSQPSQVVAQKAVLPKPAPRMRPRMQRVKRPLSRNIPPPPNIPLPPPPVRKRRTISDSSAPAAKSDSVARSEAVVEEEKPAKPSLKPKPPVLPKPAHLVKVGRTHSESSASSASSRASGGTVSPQSVEGDVESATKKQRGPKPPPPARTSSLSGVGDRPQLKKQQRASALAIISDTVEETDSPQAEEKDDKKASPKVPPPRPSPPKPVRAEQAKEAAKEGESPAVPLDHRERRDRKISDPPSYPPPPRPATSQANGPSVIQRTGSEKGGSTHGKVLFDSSKQQQKDEGEDRRTSGGSSVLSKSSSFMRSLKKIVKRSESREDSREETDGVTSDPSKEDKDKDKDTSTPKGPPPRPQPPKTTPVKPTDKESRDSPTAPPEGFPVPKPRTKLQTQSSQDQLAPVRPQSVEKEPERSQAKPVRPPPPSKEPEEMTRPEHGPEAKAGDGEPVRQKQPAKRATESQGSETELSETPAKPLPTPQANSSPSPPDQGQPSSPADDSPTTPTNFYRAARDYKAEKEGELTFSAGDILIIIEHRKGGFHYGMLDDGNTGLFPTSHVEPFYTPSSRRKN